MAPDPPSSPELASYKRIIICADGTWLASNLGNSAKQSNVATIARTIASTGIDKNGLAVKQVVYYHSGLGTGDLPFQKAIYGTSRDDFRDSRLRPEHT
jgi:uncharacterized protein (DUF2235 family)